MADPSASPATAPTSGDEEPAEIDESLRQAMELLFFAYRDFTGEPDKILAEFGYGRAHHRVIYFTGRNPGITVSDLLDILSITKQSLSRVLNQLVVDNVIFQKTDAGDRRRRMLYLTDKGRELEYRLARRQADRIEGAFKAAGPSAILGFRRVMRGLINPTDRKRVGGDD